MPIPLDTRKKKKRREGGRGEKTTKIILHEAQSPA